jgi:amino-acid N-acetyltransferase
MKVRKALIRDVKRIHELLFNYSNQGLLLARSLSELYDHLRDFYVVEGDGKDDDVLGCCALGILWDDLAEIRSLAVAEEQGSKGYATRLVKACIEEARNLGIKRIFALTYVEEFFFRMGFVSVEKSILPHKVWADCLKCAMFPNCNENAVLLEL